MVGNFEKHFPHLIVIQYWCVHSGSCCRHILGQLVYINSYLNAKTYFKNSYYKSQHNQVIGCTSIVVIGRYTYIRLDKSMLITTTTYDIICPCFSYVGQTTGEEYYCTILCKYQLNLKPMELSSPLILPRKFILCALYLMIPTYQGVFPPVTADGGGSKPYKPLYYDDKIVDLIY